MAYRNTSRGDETYSDGRPRAIIRVKFRKSGKICKGYCSGNDENGYCTETSGSYSETESVDFDFVEKHVNDKDKVSRSGLRKLTTEKCECTGSQYCSGVKVRREAVSAEMVTKKKKTLRSQYLERCDKARTK